MANSFFVPFNHQPDSITFHTAPVTLGSDEYARLTLRPYQELDDAAIQGDQGITINGTLVIPQTEWSTTDSDSGENIRIDVAGTFYEFTSAGSWFKSIEINSASYHSTANFTNGDDYKSTVVLAGDEITKQSGTNQAAKFKLVPFEPLPSELWLPPSTVISSGDGTIVRPYTLERYKTYS